MPDPARCQVPRSPRKFDGSDVRAVNQLRREGLLEGVLSAFRFQELVRNRALGGQRLRIVMGENSGHSWRAAIARAAPMLLAPAMLSALG